MEFLFSGRPRARRAPWSICGGGFRECEVSGGSCIILPMISTPPFRLIAIVLIVALAVMVATPEKADAMDR